MPLSIKRRGGRKVILAPELLTQNTEERLPDGALIKGIARAYRWQRMLEDGKYSTPRELAAAENISASYVSRLLQLTLTAPPLVEDILNGEQHAGQGAAQETSYYWHEQILTNNRA